MAGDWWYLLIPSNCDGEEAAAVVSVLRAWESWRHFWELLSGTEGDSVLRTRIGQFLGTLPSPAPSHTLFSSVGSSVAASRSSWVGDLREDDGSGTTNQMLPVWNLTSTNEAPRGSASALRFEYFHQHGYANRPKTLGFGGWGCVRIFREPDRAGRKPWLPAVPFALLCTLLKGRVGSF